MSDRIPESEWTWLGYPQHFIGAAACRFRMATMVGNYLVSTVGDYHPKKRVDDIDSEREPVGGGEDAFFETYVFRCDGMDSCGCCARVDDRCEIWGRHTSDSIKAQAMHMEACRMAAEGRLP